MFNLKMPQSIFVQADSFRRLGTQRTDPPNPYEFFATVVNCAFAVELYLKCLLFIETGQLVKSEHNLRKLFLKLPEQTRTEIENKFDALMQKQPQFDLSGQDPKFQEVADKRPTDLRESLREGGDAFVRWRYSYEDEDALNAKFFSLFPLPYILHETILNRKPEWRQWGIKVTKVATAKPTPSAGAR